MASYDQMVSKLYALLLRSPNGVDVHEIGAELDLDSDAERTTIHQVIRNLRLLLGNATDPRLAGFSVPIRIEADGSKAGRHVYFLSANVSEGAEWQARRAQTMLSRLDVDLAHWQSMVESTDGASVEGRIARAALVHFQRLQDDVALIREGYR